MQYSLLVLMLILINASFLIARPWPHFYQSDIIDEQENSDDVEVHDLTKRLEISPWVHKRNPALCDYRLQLRPLPLTNALCAYGQTKDNSHHINPFKYG
ncbi:hypothetical protein I4U23_025022 [Adineta vaga]|nr:hypothetical protein I4U23_025022 [Adineta vaga]